jgi:nitrous oxidase accessory protein NosD
MRPRRVLSAFACLITLFALSSCGGGGGTAAFGFITASLINVVFGQAYSAPIKMSGATLPVQWQIAGGALPDGLTFCTGATGDTCTITGMATQWTPTPASFTVAVTDSSSPPKTAQKTFSIKVDPAGGTLTTQTAGLPNGVLNTAYSATISATGGLAPYSWSVISGALPDGITFCSSSTVLTCALAGTATATGSFTFTAQISDSNTPAQTARRQITVQITATPPQQVTVTVAKTGNGLVTSVPSGINCGSACSAIFTGGTQITLTPLSDNGWEFKSWTGCDQAVGVECSITPQSDRSLQVDFYPLTDDMTTISGTLQLPAPLNPAQFDVGTFYGDTTPNSAGTFNIPVRTDGVTLVAAVPKSGEEGENAWMAFVFRAPGLSESPLTINALSTAQTLILMNPAFLSPDPARMKEILEILAGVPEVQSLANRIAQDFPTVVHPFDDPSFVALYQQALDAVSAALPEALLPSIVPNVESTLEPAKVLRDANPRIQANQLDSIAQLKLSVKADPYTIKVEPEKGNPLDTVIGLWEVDPYALHTYKAGANSLGPFYMGSVETVLRQANEPDATAPRFPYYTRLGTYEARALVEAKSLFKYLYVMDTIANLVLKDALGLGAERTLLALPHAGEGIYLVRGINGRFNSGSELGEWSFAWENYRGQYQQAVAVNIFNGVMDAMSVIVDIGGFLEHCGDKTFAEVTLRVSQSVIGGAVDEDFSIMFPILLTIGKTAGKEAIDCVVEHVTHHPHRAALKALKAVFSLVDVFRKIGKAGAVLERVTALAGSKTGFTPAPLFTTPLDSFLVVVGDPYSPVITSVNGVDPTGPLTPLQATKIGDPLVIEGRRFRLKSDDPDPEVLVTDETGKVVPLSGFTLSVMTGDPPSYRIDNVNLPEGLGGRVRVSVIISTGARADTPEVLEIIPIITSITPANYFRTDPHSQHKVVRIFGKGFLASGNVGKITRHRWVLGTTEYTPTTAKSDLLEFTNLPAGLPAGRQEVRVKWRDGAPLAGAEPPIFFRILGPPEATSVSPNIGYSQQVLSLTGKNFGEAPEDLLVTLETQPLVGSPQTRTQRPPLITSIESADNDQNATLTVQMELNYTDPDPGTQTKEPLSARLRVETPEGNSAYLPFTISPPPPAGSYDRLMFLPWVDFTTAIQYANQDPAPPGTVVNQVFQDVSGTCNSNPVSYCRCEVIYPPSYVRDIGGARYGVSAPPGFLGTGPVDCNACQTSFSCVSGPGLTTWEGVAPEEIRDVIRLDTINPPPPGPKVMDLSDIVSGTALRGPKVDLGLFTEFTEWKVTGRGFVVDGDQTRGFWKDGIPQEISINLRVTDAGGGPEPVITVRNARGVTLNLNISGMAASPGCEVGLLIENSREVSINSPQIHNCRRGIVIKDSEDITVQSPVISGYGMDGSPPGAGITMDGGGANSIIDGKLGYSLVNNDPAVFVIPPDQGAGVFLTGGTSGNQVFVTQVVGSATGIWVENARDNYIIPRRVGVYQQSNSSLPVTQDTNLVTTGNLVGLRVSAGAVKNIIGPGRGGGFGLCPFPDISGDDAYFLTNDVGVLVEGGQDNTFCGLYLGIIGRDVSTEQEPFVGGGNRVGVRISGSTSSQPKDNKLFFNFMSDNLEYGIEVDGVIEFNDIHDNYFALGANLNRSPATLPAPPNGLCGIHITNLSEKVLLHRNHLEGEKIAVCLDNSAGVQFRKNEIKNSLQIGVKMENSRKVSFDGDNIYSDNNTGQKGMHIMASSAFRLRAIQIRGIGGVGLEIEQPSAASFGMASVEGESHLGTQQAPAERQSFMDPVVVPPEFGIAALGSAPAFIWKNAGDGVYIHDGAKEITIANANIYENGGHGIHLKNTGDTIRIQTNNLSSYLAPGANQGDGIRIEDNTAKDILIGGRLKGNHIARNFSWGIQVMDSENITIQGNFVGFNNQAGNEFPMPNVLGGVRIRKSNNILIGGNHLQEGNVISGNGGDGIQVDDFRNFPAPQIRIEGNFVGPAMDGGWGPNGVANGGFGINLIGNPAQPRGALRITNNLIAGNGAGGIQSTDWGDAVGLGPDIITNTIGRWEIRPAFFSPPNVGNGIDFNTTQQARILLNSIGRNEGKGIEFSNSDNNGIPLNTVTGQATEGVFLAVNSDFNVIVGNEITANATRGVVVTGGSIRNTISVNSITNHPGKGIDLEIGAQGGNNEIPAPVIRFLGAGINGNYYVQGEVAFGIPDGSTVELFMDEADEGRVYLASVRTVKNKFAFSDIPPPPGETFAARQFHATVTDPNGNTSEFGNYDPDLAEFNWRVASRQNNDIALTNMATRAGFMVTTNPAVDRSPAVCQTAAGNQFVAFVSERDGNPEIYLTNDVGSPITRLTNNPAADEDPNFSADCSKIVFATNRDGNYEIYRMNRDGTGLTRLTNDPGDDRQPDFSPDGSLIVLSSNRSGSFQIYTMSATDGSGATQKSTLVGDNRHPAWKRILDKIAYENCVGSTCQVVVLTLSLAIEERFLHTAETDEQPEWFVTPGGEEYLIISARPADGSKPYNLYLMNLNGYLLLRITPEDKTHTSPSCCLSP